jgi:hypothetical protein
MIEIDTESDDGVPTITQRQGRLSLLREPVAG